MNNLSKKINQNSYEKYTEDVYRTNSKTQKSSTKLSSIFNKNLNQNGACYNDYKICMKALTAFNNNDINQALTVIMQNMAINWSCQDDTGNTILHHLVLSCEKSRDCKTIIERLLKNADVSCIINTKNYKGETPMLLAVFNGQNSIARKLERAGANKFIEDNDGNYIVTDATDVSVNQQNQQNTHNEPTVRSNITMLLALPDEPNDLTSLDLGTLNSDNRFNVDQNNSDLFIDMIKDNLYKLAKNNTQNDGSDATTEDFINKLANRYSGKNPSGTEKNQPVRVTNLNLIIDSDKDIPKPKVLPSTKLSDTSSINVGDKTLSETSEASIKSPKGTLDKLIKNNTNSEITTDELSNFVNKLKNNQGNQFGGKNKKIIGWRKLILHSDLEMGGEDSSEKNNKYKKNEEDNEEAEEDNEEDEEDEDEDEEEEDESAEKDDEESDEKDESDDEKPTNELNRLINSRKNELHTEVLNTITEMLNKGEITYKNKPLEANERNAKLIKSFLYKQISDKNPQLTGMDKILIIQKMNKADLLKLLKNLPDLDQLEKTIEEHIKNKRMQRESDNSPELKDKNKKENKNKPRKSESESD
jgi:hypothetical protein